MGGGISGRAIDRKIDRKPGEYHMGIMIIIGMIVMPTSKIFFASPAGRLLDVIGVGLVGSWDTGMAMGGIEGRAMVLKLGLECRIMIMAKTGMITMPVAQIGDFPTSCLVVECVRWDIWWVLGLREAQRRIRGCRPICCDNSLLVLFSTSPFSRSVEPTNTRHHTTINLKMTTLKGE